MACNSDAAEILRGLNLAQTMAVSSPAPVLQILAPPGSGKTKTLIARVAYLLRQHEYRPENVIVATFTVKAAREMKARLAKLLGDGLETRLILGTFHSISRRYLLRYGRLVGVRPGFGIADSADSLAIIKRIIKRNKFNIDPNKARNKISSQKAQGKYAVDMGPGKGLLAFESKEFPQLLAEYEATLNTSNLLDYDDLLLRCVELLHKFPHCVRNVEAVLIDEFQDTNVVQFDLMRLFASHRKRVTIVGDPDQSIYGFRHAEIKNLDRMRLQYPDYVVVLLEENYRSSGAILSSALGVIQQDQNRPEKNLLPTHCSGSRPVLQGFPSTDDEAAWLVSEVKRSMTKTGNALSLNDYAILLRAASLSRQIEAALGGAGISYKMVGGSRFFDRLEVKIIIDYLRVVSQPDHNDALSRIINVPPRRIGEQTVKHLLEEAETKKVTLWSLVKSHGAGATLQTKITKSAGNHLATFADMIIGAQREREISTQQQYPITTLVEHVMSKINFEEYLRRTHAEDFDGRWANVKELIAQTREFSESRGGPSMDDDMLPVVSGLEQHTAGVTEDELGKFLANLALSSEVITRDDEDGKRKEQVTISTIHAAKGLEWPVVFIPGAFEGSIPHSRAENMDEERRLLYVAMTRAQAMLYISYPMKTAWGDGTSVSSFLSEYHMKPLLATKDPDFQYVMVQSICQILRRECPSQTSVAEIVLESEKKQQKVNTGPRHASREYNTARYPGIGPHQDLITSSTIQPTTTHSFLNSSTTPGFVTAGAHLQNMRQEAAGSGKSMMSNWSYSGPLQSWSSPLFSRPNIEAATTIGQQNSRQSNERKFLTPVSANKVISKTDLKTNQSMSSTHNWDAHSRPYLSSGTPASAGIKSKTLLESYYTDRDDIDQRSCSDLTELPSLSALLGQPPSLSDSPSSFSVRSDVRSQKESKKQGLSILPPLQVTTTTSSTKTPTTTTIGRKSPLPVSVSIPSNQNNKRKKTLGIRRSQTGWPPSGSSSTHTAGWPAVSRGAMSGCGRPTKMIRSNESSGADVHDGSGKAFNKPTEERSVIKIED